MENRDGQAKKRKVRIYKYGVFGRTLYDGGVYWVKTRWSEGNWSLCNFGIDALGTPSWWFFGDEGEATMEDILSIGKCVVKGITKGAGLEDD